jgi:hypothetical protein
MDSGSRRWLGVGGVLLGGLFSYLGIWSPISKAMNHEPQISLSTKAAILVPLFFGFGLLSIILGDKFSRVIGTDTKNTKFGAIVAVVLGIAGVLLYYWVDGVVASYGYVRQQY